MMTGLNVARVAKLIALLGFGLPWLLVSCAGEPIGRLTGIDLATGGLTLQGSGNGEVQSQLGHANLWVTLSLASVIFGIVASFVVRRSRQAILTMAIAAIVALVASAVGVSSASSGAQAEPEPWRQRGAVSAIGRVDLQYGYLTTVAGLLVAIGACGMALSRRDDAPRLGAGP